MYVAGEHELKLIKKGRISDFGDIDFGSAVSIHNHQFDTYFYNGGRIYKGLMDVTEIKNLQALFPDEGEITPVTFYKNIMIFKTWTHLIIFDVISKRYVSVDNLNEIPS